MQLEPRPFTPGETFINYSVPIYDGQEEANLIEVAKSGHLAGGPWTERWERRMVEFFGARDALLVNSGSSANLLMLAALCNDSIREYGLEPLKPGDEVITVAMAFPTTVAPIVQNHLVPVFVDVEVGSYNPRPSVIEAAIGPKTRAVMLAHPLGNPFDLDAIQRICDKHKLYLVEDACDALGSRWKRKLVGSFGLMASLSHFPAHHITSGEGGTVIVNSPKFPVLLRSLRDWGRACWCLPGASNTCGMRFEWQLGDLPAGTDHKYTYTNVGYNLKATDMQASVLCAQADKIDFIVRRRQENFARLYSLLSCSAARNKFVRPMVDSRASISPYAFPLTCVGVERSKVIAHLEQAKIETRPLFAGNLLRHPAFKSCVHRVHGGLDNTDRIMRDSFFVGVHPFLALEVMDYIAEQLVEAVR